MLDCKLFFLVAVFFSANGLRDTWEGRWFPENPRDKKMMEMGHADQTCDDGKTNLEIDYDGNPVNYTCYYDRRYFWPNPLVHPILEHEHIPKGYEAMHYCMNETIVYDQPLPTFGAHRPLWPVYGEYTFVPKQRWLHSLEHGSVVMLYHPCADRNEVKLLKKIVKNCLFRHIISASADVTPERPLALLTWGYRMTFSKVDMELVVHFIKRHANHAPEHTSRDGQFERLLIERATVLSDNDTQICPFYNM